MLQLLKSWDLLSLKARRILDYFLPEPHAWSSGCQSYFAWLITSLTVPPWLSLGPHLGVSLPESTLLKAPKPTSAVSTTTYFLSSLAQVSTTATSQSVCFSPASQEGVSLSRSLLKTDQSAQACSRKMAFLHRCCLGNQRAALFLQGFPGSSPPCGLGTSSGKPLTITQFCHLLDC